ncbi:hypothetical protein [Vibrio gazogenes]|uniref:Uncharacterized protein n=1 Tax=Vibrio gazogenes TaxID=687 RepID=A0A1Z2SDM3_VIBGA|nr:hypothetical protein [Vibrio gazogenes]ASA55282.1 hypothetical protein BSQ33_05795 [Vibrio gazogenes]
MVRRTLINKFHLFEINTKDTLSYLLLKNTTIDPRSIQEDVFRQHSELTRQQVDLLLKFHLSSLGDAPQKVSKIGSMEVFPIGEELYSDIEKHELEIKLIRYSNSNFVILGTAESDEVFLDAYLDELDDYGEGYSSIVESYIVHFMPSVNYKHISDIDEIFSNCTVYDYETMAWVTPKTSTYFS